MKADVVRNFVVMSCLVFSVHVFLLNNRSTNTGNTSTGNTHDRIANQGVEGYREPGKDLDDMFEFAHVVDSWDSCDTRDVRVPPTVALKPTNQCQSQEQMSTNAAVINTYRDDPLDRTCSAVSGSGPVAFDTSFQTHGAAFCR